MKPLVSMVFVLMACGSTQSKPESPIVKGAEVPAGGCCCKTVPEADEKEIVPVYAMKGRMECSAANGECVDAVQCNGDGSASAGQAASGPTDTGVPPPPDLPSGGAGSSDTGVPPPPNLPPSGGS